MKIDKSLILGGALLGATAVYLQKRQQQKKPNQPFGKQYGPWAIVTGAARAEGIGYGFARQLAGKHLNLILVDILANDLEARADELRQKYLVKVKTVALDLGQPTFLPQLQAVTDGLEIGLLVCNHMFTPQDTPTILDMPLAMHHSMLDINARAYVSLVHTYGRQMVTQNHGGIIIVSSQAGLRGMPYTGAYSANKAYQMMLGESLWYELRHTPIDVLVLAPGLTNTQGDALGDYPAIMLMEVDPVVSETLSSLGQKHLVIPGPINKLFNFATNHFMTRQQAVVTNGDFMAKGLNK